MLLMDQIINGKARDGFLFRRQFGRAVAAAEKFILGPTVAEAADAIGTAEMKRIISFCRPPFASCWFEALEADRPNFYGSAIKLKDDEVECHRVGVLIECATAEATAFTLSLAWSFQRGGWLLSPMSVLIDLTEKRDWVGKAIAALKRAVGVGFDFGNIEQRNDCLVPCRYWHEDVGLLSKAGPQAEQAMGYMGHRAREDWGGEPIFWLSVLGLLNARNTTETTTIDNSVLNRSRKRCGRPPLSDHRKVIIRIGNAAHRSTGKGSEPEMEDVRAHFVRGHFKVRKTGIFWWSPYTRGNLAKGFAGKDYHLA